MGLKWPAFCGFPGLRLPPRRDPGNEDMEGFGDRAYGQVVGFKVLGMHVLHRKVAADFSQPLPWTQALVDEQHVLEQPHDGMDRAVVVDVRHTVNVTPPWDLAVLLPSVPWYPQ